VDDVRNRRTEDESRLRGWCQAADLSGSEGGTGGVPRESAEVLSAEVAVLARRDIPLAHVPSLPPQFS
jgi:hypothetical protein